MMPAPASTTCGRHTGTDARADLLSERMPSLRAPLLFVALCLTACEANKEVDPAIDVCQVNIDCTLVQLDSCCERSSCDADLHAETSGRTRVRLEACARKDCSSAKPAGCRASGVRVGPFCRKGRCVLEAVRPL